MRWLGDGYDVLRVYTVKNTSHLPESNLRLLRYRLFMTLGILET